MTSPRSRSQSKARRVDGKREEQDAATPPELKVELDPSRTELAQARGAADSGRAGSA